MKTQTSIQKILASTFITVLAIVVTAGTFIHFFQFKTPKELTSHYKTYKPTVDGYMFGRLDSIANNLESGKISSYEASLLIRETATNTKLNKKTYRKVRDELKDKYSWFNFPTIRIFIFQLCIFLGWLTTTVFLVISLTTKSIELKNLILKLSYLFLFVTIFWVSWVFFNEIINTNNWIYLGMFLVCSAIASYLTIKLLQYFSEKKRKDKKDIQEFIKSGFEFINEVKLPVS